MKKAGIVIQYTGLFVLACIHMQLKAQSPGIFLQTYTTANGLCNNSISSLAQDSRGFIWIGTSEGLSRYDGTYFRNFYASRDSTVSFQGNNITNIIEYKPGWLLFISGGIPWIMNTITNTFHKPPAAIAGITILRIEKIPGNRFLFSSTSGVFICDSSLSIIQPIENPFPSTPSNQVLAYQIAEDTILLASNRKAVYYTLRNKKTIPLVLSTQLSESEQITHFLYYDAKTRSLYFTNFWRGLLQYDMQGKQVQQYSTSGTAGKRVSTNHVITLLKADDSTFYIGTGKGINILHANRSVVDERYYKTIPEDEMAPPVLSFLQDRDGNVWAGTEAGLSRIKNVNSIVRNIELPFASSTLPECYKISPGENGSLYASFYGGGTWRIHKAQNSISSADQSMVLYAWSNLMTRNELYIAGGGRNKLAAYDVVTKKTRPLLFLDKYYDAADFVTLLFKDSRGDEWFSINQGGGLIRRPGGTDITEQYSRKSAVPSFSLGYAVYATEDKKGNNWFGVNKSSTLLKWSPFTQTFAELDMDTVPGTHQKINAVISYLYSSRSDTVWISYESLGLLAYDVQQHKARLLTMEDGLPTNNIYSIVTDRQHRVWMGTKKGLVCYLPAEEKFIIFKKENGLPVEQFASGAIYFDASDNELWIPGIDMFLRVDPDKLLAQNKKTIYIYLDEVSMKGRKMDPSVSYTLPYHENSFQFQFTAIDFKGGNELEFAYQLKGADADWIYIGDKRSAIYSSLNPGRYTFLVRTKRKGDPEWTLMQHPFTFTVATPWWQTWWFLLCMIAVFAGLVALVVRSYFKRRLEKQRVILEKQQAVEKERTRIATDMHDDFGASLSRIKFLSEKLQFEKGDTRKMNEDLGKISAYSDEMAEKMGEIVWALNQRYDSSGDLVSFCRSYASEFLEDKHIRLHFESSDNADIKIKGEVRRNIFLVMKEALHNIVKHAEATAVHITIHCHNHLQVVIQDNGKGFDSSSVRPFANGLENMKKRVEEIGGEIRFENQNGTRISIRVDTGIQQKAYMQ